jgi:hypothetical protein
MVGKGNKRNQASDNDDDQGHGEHPVEFALKITFKNSKNQEPKNENQKNRNQECIKQSVILPLSAQKEFLNRITIEMD